MKFKNLKELEKAYDELEKEFTKRCQELKTLKAQLELLEGKGGEIWQPKDGEHYWFIDANSMLLETNVVVEMYVDNGNCFRTQEEAKKQAEYNRVMNRFRKYVEVYSEPLDWGDSNMYKYYVFRDPCNNTLDIDWCVTRNGAFQIYASSKQILKDAIIYSAGSEEEFARIVFGVKNGN